MSRAIVFAAWRVDMSRFSTGQAKYAYEWLVIAHSSGYYRYYTVKAKQISLIPVFALNLPNIGWIGIKHCHTRTSSYRHNAFKTFCSGLLRGLLSIVFPEKCIRLSELSRKNRRSSKKTIVICQLFLYFRTDAFVRIDQHTKYRVPLV